MSSELYTIVALVMRYVFAALMLLIVARAWKITLIDARRAGSLRRLAPETGLCGEFIVISGEGRAREGMRYPVIREGLIGASRKADVRVRSKTVRRMHAFFELNEKGLRVRAQNHARMYDAQGKARHEMTLCDGSHVTIGGVELMLILINGQSASEPEGKIDDIFRSAESNAPGTREPIREYTDSIPGWDDERTDDETLILIDETYHSRKSVPDMVHFVHECDDEQNAETAMPHSSIARYSREYAQNTEEMPDYYLKLIKDDLFQETIMPEKSGKPQRTGHSPVAVPNKPKAIPGWDEEWDDKPKKKRKKKKLDDDFFDT